MTEDERTVWLCIWQHILAQDYCIEAAKLQTELTSKGLGDAQAAIDLLYQSGKVSPAEEPGLFMLEDDGWLAMARALSGRAKPASNVVSLRPRTRDW